ncbi:MFS transporter [Chitinibacter sp. S2-10]|uniref:MFS transporter n=1 Tax=Chitinibacter sp. S2-10 TaxID=3373597 RepID=UPI003977C9D0
MKRLQFRLVVLSALILLFSSALFSYFSLREFESGLKPSIAASERELAASVLRVLGKGFEHGIPYQEMKGVNEYLDQVRRNNSQISYLLLTDAKRRLLFSSQTKDCQPNEVLTTVDGGITPDSRYLNTVVPIRRGGVLLGYLYLGRQADVARQQLENVALDILTVMVVAILVAVEQLRLLLTISITTPLALLHSFFAKMRLQQFQMRLPSGHFGGLGGVYSRLNALLETRAASDRAQNEMLGEPENGKASWISSELYHSALDYIRWPFFLLVFADSLSLSFFPVYAEQFFDPALGLSRQFFGSLPISVFMLVWALAMPWAGQWCDRVGYRRAFYWGAAITTAGLILTALASGFVELLIWRSVTAFGYGTVFVTVQSYIANNTATNERTRGMAIFLSTFFSGSLAGAAIGGMVVDKLGERWTFALSALLSIMAAWFVARMISPKSGVGGSKKTFQLADVLKLMRHKKFAAITVLAAIPAKIALAGFLYYSVPLYLKSLGTSQGNTGRLMMLYSLAIILVSPTIAKLADMLGSRRWFVIIGGYVAGMAMFASLLQEGMWGLVLSIVCLGFAHAIGVSPQLALVSDYCADAVRDLGQATATGVFRLLERLGNVFGPLIASVLIAVYGFKGAFYGVGALILTTTTVFMLAFYCFDRQDAEA